MARTDDVVHCPMPAAGGGDCWAESHPASRFGLCVEHWRQTVEDWVGDAPTVSRLCPTCNTRNTLDPVDWPSARCLRCGEPMNAPWMVAEHHEYRAATTASRAEARGVVYYVRLGDLVKIGFSSSFVKRMMVIPHTEVLATEPGGYDLERQRHEELAPHRVEGTNEWFAAAPSVLEFAASLRAEHGDPRELADRIEAQHAHAEVIREFGSTERAEAEIADWMGRHDG